MPQLRSLYLAPMLFTLTIWRRITEQFPLSSKCSPFMNVLFNLDIPDGLSYMRMLPWTQVGIFQFRHLVHPVIRKLMSFSDLKAKYKLPVSLVYSYIQFKHFFHSNSLEKNTVFEILYANGPYETKQISSIYKILHETPPLTELTHNYMKKWSHILQRPISILDWGKM